MADRQRPFIGDIARDPEMDLGRDGETCFPTDGVWGGIEM